MGQNDGGIKRGDRAETGDEQARPTEGVGRGGSGVRGERGGGGPSGHPTADPSSLGGDKPTSRGTPGNEDELDVRDATDESLGTSNKEDYY